MDGLLNLHAAMLTPPSIVGNLRHAQTADDVANTDAFGEQNFVK
ncbi:MAG: hypothetical protein AAGJ87_13140 [Pseudomonadota bacterium]